MLSRIFNSGESKLSRETTAFVSVALASSAATVVGKKKKKKKLPCGESNPGHGGESAGS